MATQNPILTCDVKAPTQNLALENDVVVAAQKDVLKNKIEILVRSGYAAVSHNAEKCLILPRPASNERLFLSKTFATTFPRSILFYWSEYEALSHHRHAYLAQATPVVEIDQIFDGQWMLHVQDNAAVRVKRAALAKMLADDACVDENALRGKEHAPIPAHILERIERSRELGLVAPDDSVLVPVRLGVGLRDCEFSAWTMHYLDPTFDNSPLVNPRSAGQFVPEPEIPRAIETLGGKVIQPAFKHAEWLAIERRLFLMTADMGGEGTPGDRVRKRFCVMSSATLRRVFVDKKARAFWVHGEWTGDFLYEYLVTQRASRMYLDIDIKKEQGRPGMTGDTVSLAAIGLVCEMACEIFGLALTPADFLVLECDRKDKVSRHIIVRPMVMETVTDARVFAAYLHERVLTQPDRWGALIDALGECVIDPAVYNTGCQSFRPYGCSKAPDKKHGAKHTLRIAEMNQCPLPEGADDFDLMLFSMVQLVSFAESPPETRLRFDTHDQSAFVAFRGKEGRSLAPCREPGAKRKRKETKILRVRQSRAPSANEVPLPVGDKDAVLRELRSWLEPCWEPEKMQLQHYEVRLKVGEYHHVVFEVFRKSKKGGYCAVLAGTRQSEGIYDPARHCHKSAGVQFYIYEGRSGWACKQRCHWKCGPGQSVLVAHGKQSDVLSQIRADRTPEIVQQQPGSVAAETVHQ